jgi:hypothetical protein
LAPRAPARRWCGSSRGSTQASPWWVRRPRGAAAAPPRASHAALSNEQCGAVCAQCVCALRVVERVLQASGCVAAPAGVVPAMHGHSRTHTHTHTVYHAHAHAWCVMRMRTRVARRPSGLLRACSSG